MPKFPFTNYHELNLDWILKKVTALFDASEENAQTIRTYETRLTSAEQTATSAGTAATAAQQLADAAAENANSALSVAGTADSKADSALTAATNAADAVAGALTTAQEAQQTAAAAVATANDAAATASSLESLANTANQNATAALETAQTADQKTVAAQSAAATADQKAVAAQSAATTNAGNITTLQTDVSNLNRQLSDVEENQIPELKSAFLRQTHPGDNVVTDLVYTQGGYYDGSQNDAYHENANWGYTDKISITAGKIYFVNTPVAQYINFYDSNGDFISGLAGVSAVAPDNAAFIRLSIIKARQSVAKLTADAPYTDYVAELENRVLPVTAISPNLHNPNTDHDGYYFNDGSYRVSSNYNATDRIPVEIGKTYYFSNDGVGVKARFVSFYSLAGYYQHGSDVQYADSVTIGNNIGSIVVSYAVAYTKFQIEPDAVTKYFPYGATYIPADVIDGIDILENKNLRTNHALNTGDYPTSLRTGYKVIFSANITDGFTAFTIQRGTDTETSEQVVVGLTSLRYICSGTVISVTHGLTWKDKCDVIIESTDLAHTRITLITNGGLFVNVFERPKGYGSNGVWTSSDTMNGTLVQQISKPHDIWIIGDSYMSFANNRLGGALYEIGQTNPTILSIPGATTGTMADQFIKMIDCYHVIPSVVCVCTGMNDTSAVDYQTGLNKILEYALKYGIEVIVTVIPITPSRTSYNTAVDNYILTLNYPKIRFDQAVGSNASGVWYDGCLDQDNLHPTQTGARLLTAELLRVVGYLCN